MVIPVFAAFERVPDSLIDASSDLGASDLSTLRMVVAPLVFPGIAAGSIFTFSLSLGDYIAVTIVGGKTQTARQCHLRPTGHRQQSAAGRGAVDHPAGRDHRCTCWRCAAPARWRTSDAVERRAARGPGMDRAGPGIPLCPTGFWWSSTRSTRRARSPSRRAGSRCSGGSTAWQQRGDVEVAGQLGGGRPRRHGDRAGARHDGRVRRAAVSTSSAATW